MIIQRCLMSQKALMFNGTPTVVTLLLKCSASVMAKNPPGWMGIIDCYAFSNIVCKLLNHCSIHLLQMMSMNCP